MAASGEDFAGNDEPPPPHATSEEAVAAPETQSPERMAKEKLDAGLITQEEHDIIVETNQRFRRMSEAADSGFSLGDDEDVLDSIDKPNDKDDVVPVQSHETQGPTMSRDPHMLASDVPVYSLIAQTSYSDFASCLGGLERGGGGLADSADLRTC